ncbi:hypothetical protein OC846_002685 [Tilletia horrida]|uniref:Carbohydrate-binding module family 13 protein n=1 Tax=Tilletia horrida TaxID=155126 RepID=A0AAN6JRX0_9BASI|nr:hypothetical protein OC845_004667 [Tilletia horrida]KAK0552962.1 hypothetical protein OC846_002685 [Tilletia horrida]KAK0566250.1 hypothetical protein OC861_003329 [Tilletia horrida]
MFHSSQLAFVTLAVSMAASVRADASSASFSLNNLPKTWQDGQTGTNQCKQWMPSSQDSLCQNAFINSASDFCLWASRTPGAIGDTERDEVSWCTKPGYGTRVIPDGTLASVHFVKTPTYVQVTGTGDFTKMNIVANDPGGELDPHGADGNGNPIGGLVYTNAFNGQYQQIHQWTNFMSATEYCFKACIDADDAETQCNHVYDVQGCEWNMPANYGDGFEQCLGEPALYPGVYGQSTFYQAQDADADDYVNNAPPPHPAPASSSCSPQPSPSNGILAAVSTTSASGVTSAPAATGMSTSVLGAQNSGGKTASPASSGDSQKGAATRVTVANSASLGLVSAGLGAVVALVALFA